MTAYDLLYAPIRHHAKGSLMDYTENLDALDAASAAITNAITGLRKAADALAGGGWKKLDVPGRPDESGGVRYVPPIDKPLDIAEWRSFDEIKAQAETYWSALADAKAAYEMLSASEKRHVRKPDEPPRS